MKPRTVIILIALGVLAVAAALWAAAGPVAGIFGAAGLTWVTRALRFEPRRLERRAAALRADADRVVAARPADDAEVHEAIRTQLARVDAATDRVNREVIELGRRTRSLPGDPE